MYSDWSTGKDDSSFSVIGSLFDEFTGKLNSFQLSCPERVAYIPITGEFGGEFAQVETGLLNLKLSSIYGLRYNKSSI